jgi:hypothetical protein
LVKYKKRCGLSIGRAEQNAISIIEVAEMISRRGRLTVAGIHVTDGLSIDKCNRGALDESDD